MTQANNTPFQKPTIIVPLQPLWFQCECGFREFAIQGFTQQGGLRVSRVVCARKDCNRRYDLDTKGRLAGFIGGRMTHIIHKGKVIENG